jgi:hypothetical protein
MPDNINKEAKIFPAINFVGIFILFIFVCINQLIREMRKFIYGFCSAIALFLLCAATPIKDEILTIKPTKPVSIHFKEFYGSYDEVTQWIKDEHAKGFILKSVATNGSTSTGRFNIYVITEKY